MPLNEDFDYQNSGFGVEATFSVNGSDLAVWGHFTGATETVNLLSGQPEANDAAFACNSSEVESVKNGMTVEIDGNTYTVKRKQKLGTGDTEFSLKT